MSRIFFTISLLIICGTALAEEGGFWYLQTSAYTTHWKKDPQHNNRQELIGIERNRANGLVLGGAIFLNSYSQRSNYIYAGKRFDLEGTIFYAKVTGGALQGYRGKYRDKIPLNKYGVAPAIIPSVGMHMGPVGAELVMLGDAAAMINVGLRY